MVAGGPLKSLPLRRTVSIIGQVKGGCFGGEKHFADRAVSPDTLDLGTGRPATE